MHWIEVWPKHHVLFSWFFSLVYMHYVLLAARKCRFRIQVLPCLRVVSFHLTFGFPFSWTTNCFLDTSFMGGWKVHLLWSGLPFSLNFGFFWPKGTENMEREWSYQKINAVFGLNLLKYPYKYYYLRKKNFGTWKSLHSHSFDHVTWKHWVGLPGKFVSFLLYHKSLRTFFKRSHTKILCGLSSKWKITSGFHLPLSKCTPIPLLET